MNRRHSIAALFFAMLLCGRAAGEDVESGRSVQGILAPYEGAPRAIEAGDAFDALVRLRLPLTPPPGVQQVAAVEGWTVALERCDVYSMRGARSSSRYELSVIRIRPAGEYDVYRITQETVPWLLPGRYDLEIVGPGFRDVAFGAVIIGKEQGCSMGAGMLAVAGEKEIFWLEYASLHNACLLVEVPPRISGIELLMNKAVKRPVRAAFSSLKGGVAGEGRILMYEVDPAGTGQPGSRFFRIREKKAEGCDAKIVWQDPLAAMEATEWREAAWRSRRKSLAVIWRFQDGKWGEGLSVSHRWFFKNEAEVEAAAIDELGGVCRAASRIRLNTLKDGARCSCNGVGQRYRFASLPLAAFFLLTGWVAE